MDARIQDKLDRTRKYLLESALPEDTKDVLQSLLDTAAEATNGHEDKLQAITEALFSLAIHETKQAVRHPAQIATAVRNEMAGHVAACRWRSVAASMPAWAMPLYAFRWQVMAIVCIGVFSPQAPEIARIVAAAIHK